MPGYLSNRVISLLPATQSELAATNLAIDGLDTRIDATELNIISLTTRITTAEGDIEDLQLNVGV
jgi:hypothetical protein